ncbi:MAG: sulfur oxidation c-type cytochrome SoxX [Halocynthiibacter sp.]
MKLMKLGVAAFVATTTAALAADPQPQDVKFTEDGEVAASLTGVAGDAKNGRDVIGSKKRGNCVACHAITEMSDVPWHGEVGPSLDGAADRWSEAQLRGIITDAKMTFEGSMMPTFYKKTGYIRPGEAYTGKAPKGELTTLLSAQEIEDVVAYLLTLKE